MSLRRLEGEMRAMVSVERRAGGRRRVIIIVKYKFVARGVHVRKWTWFKFDALI